MQTSARVWAWGTCLLLTTACFSIPELGSKHDAGGKDGAGEVAAEATDAPGQDLDSAADALDSSDLLDVFDVHEASESSPEPFDVAEPQPEAEDQERGDAAHEEPTDCTERRLGDPVSDLGQMIRGADPPDRDPAADQGCEDEHSVLASPPPQQLQVTSCALSVIFVIDAV